MKIDQYKFGMIIIDGKLFNKDLIIFPDRILQNWQRQEGHSLVIEDLKEVIKFNPNFLIIGTGANGVMQVPDATLQSLLQLKIKVICEITPDACNTFNKLISQQEKVAGAFHLTC